MSTPDSSASFGGLAQAFLSRIGQPADLANEVSGFEFECGAYTVSVAPVGGAKIMVEVSVTVLQPDEAASAPLLMTLHRLNALARAEHGWVTTIDDDNTLLLSALFPPGELDPNSLEAAIVTAIDRAEVLSALVARLLTETDEDHPTPPGTNHLRG